MVAEMAPDSMSFEQFGEAEGEKEGPTTVAVPKLSPYSDLRS